ncbi:GNAT family N-acetyltransferase [Flavobacteriaceae bacterium M23B6Z8]
MDYTIDFIPENELPVVIAFWQLLDKSLSKELLLQRLDEMILQGYKCVGIYEGDKLIGICGIWILVKYYMGKHIELDNAVIDPEYRGKGLGALLSKWIINYANSIGCNGAELNCYVQSFDAQKFWINQGYKIVGYHFQQKLQDEKN